MAKRSKTAQEAINRLYAILATASAQRAVKRIEIGDAAEAEKWATVAVSWLNKSSAQAISWYYTSPRADA